MSASKKFKTLPKPSVIFITPEDICQNIGAAVQTVQAVLAGGISLVQVRDKNSSPFHIKQLIHALLASGAPAQKLVINGMAPIDVLAIHSGLGVHIKEKDIDKYLREAIEIMPHGGTIGCAVHSVLSAIKTIDIHEPSYLQVGTMYSTQSHPGKIPEGPKLLTQIRNAVEGSTLLFGVGGIKESNLASVIKHGADGIAVITQLSRATDPQRKSASLVKLCKIAYQARERNKHETERRT